MNTEIVRTLALAAGSLCALATAAVQSYSNHAERRERIQVIEADPSSAQSFDRVDAKNRVVRELLTGQITFWQAASRFRQINRTTDGAPPICLPNAGPRPRSIPAENDDQRNCMQVLLYIDCAIDFSEDQRRAAIERFEAMFLRALRTGIQLPGTSHAAAQRRLE